MPEPVPDTPERRLIALLAAVVIAVSLIGIVTGIAPERYQAKRPKLQERADPGDVPPARTHAELEIRPWTGGPAASGWSEGRELARREAEERWETGYSAEAARDDRARRRAFDGAPPVVPHPVRPGGAPECVACHLDGFALAGRRASVIPHRIFASCTQCHVSSAPSLGVAAGGGPAAVPTSFVGLASSGAGETAYEGAPPAVPHSTWMRERCDSCHGADGRAALKTPHKERRSCLQCHPAVSEHNSLGSR